VPGIEPFSGVTADTSHTLDGRLRTGRRPGAF
jgi:hypothetical protein